MEDIEMLFQEIMVFSFTTNQRYRLKFRTLDLESRCFRINVFIIGLCVSSKNKIDRRVY